MPNEKQISDCCQAEMENECADEGTCCFRCLKCGNACDIYIEKDSCKYCFRCNDNGCPACDGTRGSKYNPEPY